MDIDSLQEVKQDDAIGISEIFFLDFYMGKVRKSLILQAIVMLHVTDGEKETSYQRHAAVLEKKTDFPYTLWKAPWHARQESEKNKLQISIMSTKRTVTS